ncbi:MAG: hypothetical protein HY078_05240 [Elusimicrobia bacterium]|nr:hypothetical protein [Elusimicrobiota bacterium]
MPKYALLAACLALSGCVEIPVAPGTESAPQDAPTPGSILPGLDPGYKDEATLHFKIQAYGSDRAAQIGGTVEDLYSRIMMDTSLYSFAPPRGMYSIVVYANQGEYVKKTRMPEWSGGITLGNAIYSFDGQGLPMTLAHEMSHLLWHEYMGSPRMDLRWLNEGLAVYEEGVKAASLGYQSGVTFDVKRQLREMPIPFDQMVNLVPATERERMVSLWYRQVGDVVRYMIERGGRNGFSAFLAALKDNRDMDTALRGAFPGVWAGMGDLENQWRRNL